MVLRVTLDWVIGQCIHGRCHDRMENVSGFPFSSFTYLGLQ